MPIKNDELTEKSQNEEFDEFDYLIVREQYCMACDGPLRSYQRLICHDCLEEGADVLKHLVDSLEQEDKYIFIDPDFVPSSEEESLEEERVEEEEDQD